MTTLARTTHRQSIRLADGRELIYYDHQPGLDRSAADQRADLPTLAAASEVRWDPLFEEHAIIAGHRQARTHQPPSTACPLCPTVPGRASEIPATEYQVVVFENRFPAFAPGPSAPAPPGFEHLVRRGSGRCEVVCFSSDHNTCFADLPPDDAALVLDVLADRTAVLAARHGIEYVFCFENRGSEIGVTLPHPHGQIYAYPMVPPRFVRAGQAAWRHRERTGRCVQCEMLETELGARDRVVRETDDWVAYVPFAARWPYQVRVVPRQHMPDLPALDADARASLADVYQDVLRRFDRLFDRPAPYIAAWLQAPVREFRGCWHFAVEVFTIRRASDRLKYLAGAESAAGTWINDIAPEVAAVRLRANA
jgi:UDPglucose--hexose-1-phosphate uridylyltransferase